MFYGHFCTNNSKKSKPFCNLNPLNATTEKGQINSGSQKVKFSDWYFRTKNMCFWTSLISGFQKCHFIFVQCLEMLKITVWKNDIINGYGFWAVWLPKIDTSTWNLAIFTGMVRQLNVRFYENFENFGLWKKLYENFSSWIFGR